MEEKNIKVEEKKIVIGSFKPKERLIEFIGSKGNIQFIANEALIEAKYLSGLDMDGITLKLTICDEGTVNFEEVDTTKTTHEQRGRLLEVIMDKTISPFNKKMIVTDLPFKSINKIKDMHIDLYLSVEYQTPISRLASIFDNEDVEISDNQNSNLDSLLSMFDDDKEEPKIEEKIEIEEQVIVVENSEANKALENSFIKMKEEKVLELKSRLAHVEKELKGFEREKSQAEQRIDTAKTDIKVIESRIDSLKPVEDNIGYYFNVSEQLNEKNSLDKDTYDLILNKISKVKGINPKGFMQLFEQGEYIIKIGQKIENSVEEITDYKGLPDNIKESLIKIGVSNDQDKLIYVGDLKWHDLVGKFIKSGYQQDSNFDKNCGSNSYSINQKSETEQNTEN